MEKHSLDEQTLTIYCEKSSEIIDGGSATSRKLIIWYPQSMMFLQRKDAAYSIGHVVNLNWALKPLVDGPLMHLSV